MKNIVAVFLTILILSVAGCQSKEDVVEPLQITGKWQLVKVQATSMIANQPSTPEEPPYQEIFEFKADGTVLLGDPARMVMKLPVLTPLLVMAKMIMAF